MIPQDYRGDADPAALESRAIGQDWVAHRIRAKKAIILLRTAGNPYPLRNPFAERAAAHESGLGTLRECRNVRSDGESLGLS
jgi:hypothetical protein